MFCDPSNQTVKYHNSYKMKLPWPESCPYFYIADSYDDYREAEVEHQLSTCNDMNYDLMSFDYMDLSCIYSTNAKRHMNVSFIRMTFPDPSEELGAA